MKKTIAITIVFAALLLAVVPPSASEPQPDPQAFDPTGIPYVLRHRGGAGAIHKGFQRGIVNTDAFAKSVTIDWAASAIMDQPPDYTLVWDSDNRTLGPYKTQSRTQMFQTRFYPTASCIISQSSALVSGVTTSGRLTIERWDFVWPSPMPAPATDTASGVVSVPVTLPSRSMVRTVWSEDLTPGRYFVKILRAIASSNADPASCLVVFYDSNDVYTLDLVDGSMSLLASATDPNGQLGIVASLSPNTHYWSEFGNHISAGFVYHLGRGLDLQPPPTAGDPLECIFVDADRNGTIDSVLQLTTSEYLSQGWNDSTSYLPYDDNH